MNFVDLLLRWMHIFSAVTLAGGTFFLYFVWWPSTRNASHDEREADFDGMRKSWAMLVMLTTLFLLISGLVNAVLNIKRYDLPGVYHGLVAVKLLVGFILFFVSARIAGRSDSAVKFRQSIGTWLLINTLLASLLIAIGGYMKCLDRPLKAVDATTIPIASSGSLVEP